MKIKEFTKRLKSKGGKGYLVGGYVRDKIISQIQGTEFHYKDRDYAVSGMTVSEFESAFSEAKKIGTEAMIHKNGENVKERTPVYLLNIDDEISEVALVRNEIKEGNGHKGFSFVYNKNTTIIDDLKRRDFTMNAMAIELETGKLIDPFEGKKDIEQRIIRGIFIEEEKPALTLKEGEFKAINNEWYIKKKGKTYNCKLPQDPLRGIRAGRFASKLGFTIESDTLMCMENLKEEIKYLSTSRLYEETKKAAVGRRPDLFLQTMKDSGLLEEFLPEINKLSEFEHTPDKHPEGNVFEHTKQVALAASILSKVLLPGKEKDLQDNVISAIFHDVGKAVTQTYDKDLNRYRYLKHESKGVPIVQKFLKRWNITHWKDQMETVTNDHMMFHYDFTNLKPTKLLNKLFGGIVRKQFSPEEIKTYSNCFVTSEGLKTADNLDDYVKTLMEKKEIVAQLLKKCPLVFKDEIKDKVISKKEWNMVKNLDYVNKKTYLEEKMIRDGMFNKYYYYEKISGIAERVNLNNFMIICGADSLGRLKNKENIENVLFDIAEIMKNHRNLLGKNRKVLSWKKKYELMDVYVEDFLTFFRNYLLVEEFEKRRGAIVPEVVKKELYQRGMKADDVEFLYFEDIRKQEMSLFAQIKGECLISE